MEIDSSNVSLAFSYTITVVPNEYNEIADVKIVGYSFPGVQNYITYLQSGQTSVQSSVARNVDSVTIRVYVEWDDDVSTSSLTDMQDTILALYEGEAIIDIDVSFSQQVN